VKRIILLICFIAAACFVSAAAASDAEPDSITDIQEKPSYEKGAYTAGTEGNTTTVKKDEGFDFKVPEIRITGQVDTKNMLKREITSLEDLQSVKNILYEKEKIYMPDYYLKEESLSPKALDIPADRDYIGQLKLSAGSYTNILADGIIGKAFDKDNKAVFRMTHNNFLNNSVNNRDTYDNLNFGDLFYATKYDFIDAVYRVNADISSYGNPYTDAPGNIFGKEMDTSDVSLTASFSGKADEYGFSGTMGYTYFNTENDLKEKIYKENRTVISALIDRDFDIDKGRKMKLVSSLDFWAAEQRMAGTVYQGVVNADLLVKGILYFEPVVVQVGLRLVDYRLTGNNFYLGFYLNANYDIMPDLSIYAAMDPTMRAPDYTLLMPGNFLLPDAVKPSTDLLDIKTGINWNVAGVFVDAYWGYKTTNDSLMLDEVPGARYYTLLNNDLEYSRAGISVEALKLKAISLNVSYEYKNIIKTGAYTQTYLPQNEFALKGSYELAEWNFNLALKMLSGFMGTQLYKAGAYAVIDASVSRKINGMLSVTGYINNLLNNNYYLLYYYKEKNINLGLGVTLNF
jgi:outer membrane receptor protein involved in Fe transport